MQPDKVFSIKAPARLHLGFLDLHGGLGRRFGGLGLALRAPAVRLVVGPADTLRVDGPEAAHCAALARRFFAFHDRPPAARITVKEHIPRHQGLGSGTQTALAVGHALARLCGLPADSAALMRLFGRGRRSGVGLGAFARGGLVVDGGKAGDAPPPLIVRAAFPAAWRVLLIGDSAREGLHGASEDACFARDTGFSDACAGYLCRVLALQLLPALATRDFAAFAAAVDRMQHALGDYFAPMQGGQRIASPLVRAALEHAAKQGIKGVGQSSWGPTGFVFARDGAEARRLAAMLRREIGDDVTVRIAAADNGGPRARAVNGRD